MSLFISDFCFVLLAEPGLTDLSWAHSFICHQLAVRGLARSPLARRGEKTIFFMWFLTSSRLAWLMHMMARIQDNDRNEQNFLRHSLTMVLSHFRPIQLAKSESKGEHRFKLWVERITLRENLQRHIAKSMGFRKAIWDTNTIDLPQGDRLADPNLDNNVIRTMRTICTQW